MPLHVESLYVNTNSVKLYILDGWHRSIYAWIPVYALLYYLYSNKHKW